MTQRYLYPPIHKHKFYHLEVDEIHNVYVEECGNPEGVPVVFLHGGPGSGCESWHRRFFNPEHYRIILFDQRGCGRSKPHAELENNTTQHLISDMETIRKHINVEKWVVFGGSWGSTLALAYAEEFPVRVSALIIRGIFLCSPKELHWFYQEGASEFFPDYWEEFLKPIPVDQRSNLLDAYHRQLTGENEIAQMRAAKAWSTWEANTANLDTNDDVIEHFTDPHNALAIARIETHYFMNKGFLEPNQLLDNAHKLKGIPTHIIHGRYDMICPIRQAFDLSDAMPNAELRIVGGTGHAASEPGIMHCLVESTDQMLGKLT